MSSDLACVLVVDDNETNRDLLTRRLKRQGYLSVEAEDGKTALAILRSQPVDFMLLDIMMPEVNGYEVLEQVKTDPALRHIPVVMISAIDEIESIVRCIELGAEDYLFKPFNPTLLKARVQACLEKKRLYDLEKAYAHQIEAERQKAEKLLLNILPETVATQLKQESGTLAESFPDATVLFADIVNFSDWASNLAPIQVVEMLNQIFSRFDQLVSHYGLEKIKTIGDAYMAVGGLPRPRADHAEAIAELALDMLIAIAEFDRGDGRSFQLRIGVNTGPVVAGVIGTQKFIYDLWGDTVNVASRMESHSETGRIQVTTTTYQALKEKYRFQQRGPIQVKGKGELVTYFLMGRQEGP